MTGAPAFAQIADLAAHSVSLQAPIPPEVTDLTPAQLAQRDAEFFKDLPVFANVSEGKRYLKDIINKLNQQLGPHWLKPFRSASTLSVAQRKDFVDDLNSKGPNGQPVLTGPEKAFLAMVMTGYGETLLNFTDGKTAVREGNCERTSTLEERFRCQQDPIGLGNLDVKYQIIKKRAEGSSGRTSPEEIFDTLMDPNAESNAWLAGHHRLPEMIRSMALTVETQDDEPGTSRRELGFERAIAAYDQFVSAGLKKGKMLNAYAASNSYVAAPAVNNGGAPLPGVAPVLQSGLTIPSTPSVPTPVIDAVNKGSGHGVPPVSAPVASVSANPPVDASGPIAPPKYSVVNKSRHDKHYLVTSETPSAEFNRLSATMDQIMKKLRDASTALANDPQFRADHRGVGNLDVFKLARDYAGTSKRLTKPQRRVLIDIVNKTLSNKPDPSLGGFSEKDFFALTTTAFGEARGLGAGPDRLVEGSKSNEMNRAQMVGIMLVQKNFHRFSFHGYATDLFHATVANPNSFSAWQNSDANLTRMIADKDSDNDSQKMAIRAFMDLINPAIRYGKSGSDEKFSLGTYTKYYQVGKKLSFTPPSSGVIKRVPDPIVCLPVVGSSACHEIHLNAVLGYHTFENSLADSTSADD